MFVNELSRSRGRGNGVRVVALPGATSSADRLSRLPDGRLRAEFRAFRPEQFRMDR